MLYQRNVLTLKYQTTPISDCIKKANWKNALNGGVFKTLQKIYWNGARLVHITSSEFKILTVDSSHFFRIPCFNITKGPSTVDQFSEIRFFFVIPLFSNNQYDL